MATLDQVRADLQSLTQEEREQLFSEFFSGSSEETAQIESTLQSRMEGSFITFESHEAHDT